jgi:hypothetical protein
VAGKLLPYLFYRSSYKYPPFVSPQEYFGSDLFRVLTVGPVILKHMLRSGPWFLVAFLIALNASAVSLPLCSQGAAASAPCELRFDLQSGDLPASASAYKDELLNVEFRSPRATTYLMRAFSDDGRSLRIRFTPPEPGNWTYHVSSSVRRYDNQEAAFTVADFAGPGLVNVANLRHWRTTNKKPHLWLGVSLPLHLDQAGLEAWLDARRKDGFTHVRCTLLSGQPFTSALEPDPAYFKDLDDRLLAVATRGFILDLLLADRSIVDSPAFRDRERLDPIVRYLCARYAGLNVTWQGIERFEDIPGARALLKDLGSLLQKYDGFQHPRSTDARVSSSPLLPDGWMNFLIEASSYPGLAAVEHQFTEQPEIHVITTADPDAFRHELWTSTTNGEYPSVSADSLKNEANLKAIQTWVKVLADTRHWELEPYFDVDGARAVGLEEVEYLAYAQTPGIVEITLPKHKYNPQWVNPITGEEIPLKDYKGEVFSRPTPDTTHDWVLQVPREGHKESMLRYYYFESQDPPVQEVESDPAKAPFEIAEPPGDQLNPLVPTSFKVKLTRTNRATRNMQYIWWGEVVAGGQGARVLGLGSNGNFTLPPGLSGTPGANLNLRIQAINANGKAYELNKVYRLTP